jgi:hypothetical protein
LQTYWASSLVLDHFQARKCHNKSCGSRLSHDQGRDYDLIGNKDQGIAADVREG